MNQKLEEKVPKMRFRRWQIILLIISGIGIFSSMSILELNYFLRGYLVILELQVAIGLLVLLSLKKSKDNTIK